MKHLSLALLTFCAIVLTSCLYDDEDFFINGPDAPGMETDSTGMEPDTTGGGMDPDTTGGGMDPDTTGGGGGMDPDTTGMNPDTTGMDPDTTGGGGSDPNMGGGMEPDTTSPSDPNDLIGAWSAVYFRLDSEVSLMVGAVNLSTTTRLASTEIDYTLTLDGTNWTTAGGYSYDVSVTGTDPSFPDFSTNETISNVVGNGTYSATPDSLTIDDGFFTLDYEGIPEGVAPDGPQTLAYFFRNDTLFFSERTEEQRLINGITSTSASESESAWVRN